MASQARHESVAQIGTCASRIVVPQERVKPLPLPVDARQMGLLPCRLLSGHLAVAPPEAEPFGEGLATRSLSRGERAGVRAGVISNLKLESSSSSERGVALVITLILLSVITFMAIAFLVISRHASEAVTGVTQQAIAKQAAADAVQQVEGNVIATMLAKNEGFDFGPMVSQNYQSPFFTPGLGLPANLPIVTNVNYYYANGTPLSAADEQQMLNNLLVLPRPPVFITTNAGFPPDFRFYHDMNRNGIYDPTTINGQTLVVTNQFNEPEPVTAGDPEWIGVLEHPDQPHSRSNYFAARYCFFAQPIGNSLDINFIHNHAKQNGLYAGDGFLRNQGVGSWEINLAGFLNGLNPNYWDYKYQLFDTSGALSTGPSLGNAFQDAASILQYRYNGTYFRLPSMGAVYPNSVGIFFPDIIDYYSVGPLMGPLQPPSYQPPLLFQNAASPNWSGAGNANQMFTSQDFFTAPNSSAVTPPNPAFVTRLGDAGRSLPIAAFPDPNFNRYTYYRMLAQMGMESAPEPDTKLNLNYMNIGGYDATNFNSWNDRIIEFPLGSGIFTNAALVFFTNAANLLLTTQTNTIIPGGFGVPTNLWTGYIPVYPTNYYTPSVHRMLQLAANIYDAANPKNTNVTGFDYPSVFRPIFGTDNTNIWVKGYVEVTDTNVNTADYRFPAYSLTSPADLNTIFSTLGKGSRNFNVYGVPWVIGAKKGLPNFNQISLESFTQLTRKLQIVKPSLSALRPTWHTNVQYVLSVSNALMAEAWNSYAGAYPRAVDIQAGDALNMTLTNENGIITPAAFYSVNFTAGNQITVPANTWAGVGFNMSSNIAGSFRFPLLVSTNFLPGDIYSTTAPNPSTGTFVYNANPLAARFDTTTGYPLPRLGLNLTNRLQFVMVDHATGRVIDYVQLDGMGGQRDLTGFGELHGNDDWGPGGVWDTNRTPTGSGSLGSPLMGIENQISASQQPPTMKNAGYTTPVTSNDWNSAVTESMGFSSVAAAAVSFNAFFNKNTNVNNHLVMQVPFTPTRTVCVYYTWQANDPLVHYTLPDLTDLIDSTSGPQTNWVYDNLILTNLGQINQRYEPWGGSLNGGNIDYNTNMALKDPLVTRSDDWQFPNYKVPNIGWLGRVHRGTPWQTVYMKSSLVDPALWQKWTGNTAFYPGTNLANLTSDSIFSQPTNDWGIFDLFTTAPNDNATRGQLSVNQPNYAAWAAVLDGVMVLTNHPVNGLTNMLIDPNAANGAVDTIFTGIQNARSLRPGGVFTRVGDILAAPALSVASPFLNTDPNSPKQPDDAAYERLPQQIMSLLRVGQPRYVIYAYGQSLKPADRSIVSSGSFFGTCTNYQITGEVVTRTVVRFEPVTPFSPNNAFSPTNAYAAFNPTQNPVMPQLFPLPGNPGGVFWPHPQIRAVVENFTVLPPDYP
jgi:hypothetical protein